MVYVLPDSCGYTKNEGLLEYHESIQVTYIDKLGNMYETNPQPQYLLPNNVKGIEDLAKYGITPDQVFMATEKGFAIDRNTILGMGIPEKALLPWCHSNMIHLKQADAYKDFAALLNPGQGSRGLRSNPKQASQMIENAMLTGFDAIDHYRVVSTILKPGSD